MWQDRTGKHGRIGPDNMVGQDHKTWQDRTAQHGRIGSDNVVGQDRKTWQDTPEYNRQNRISSFHFLLFSNFAETENLNQLCNVSNTHNNVQNVYLHVTIIIFTLVSVNSNSILHFNMFKVSQSDECTYYIIFWCCTLIEAVTHLVSFLFRTFDFLQILQLQIKPFDLLRWIYIAHFDHKRNALRLNKA